MKELVMNDYLRNLDALFKQYGVTEAFSEYPFSSNKEDGVTLYADIPYKACDDFFRVMDRYIEDEEHAWPELRSGCLPLSATSKPLRTVYKDGKFYE